MTAPKRPIIGCRVELTGADIETITDAERVLADLDTVRPEEITSLFHAMHYDNLQIVVRDLLRIFGVGD